MVGPKCVQIPKLPSFINGVRRVSIVFSTLSSAFLNEHFLKDVSRGDVQCSCMLLSQIDWVVIGPVLSWFKPTVFLEMNQAGLYYQLVKLSLLLILYFLPSSNSIITAFVFHGAIFWIKKLLQSGDFLHKISPSSFEDGTNCRMRRWNDFLRRAWFAAPWSVCLYLGHFFLCTRRKAFGGFGFGGVEGGGGGLLPVKLEASASRSRLINLRWEFIQPRAGRRDLSKSESSLSPTPETRLTVTL